MVSPRHSCPARHGSAAAVALVAVLLIALAAVAWWISAAHESVVPSDPPAQPNTMPTLQVTPAQAITGTVQAIRQADGLPTWVLTDLGAKSGVTPGDHLRVSRAGAAVVTLLVETLPEDGGSMCRVQADTWTPGADKTLTVGESVTKP